MKTPLLVSLALLSLTLPARSQTAAPAKPAVVLPPQKAFVAAEKFGNDGKVNPGFLAAHGK
jgi:hypothetical protein